MKYLIILLLSALSINTFSYAGYNWKNNQKLGAIGCILLAAASILLPSIMILLR